MSVKLNSGYECPLIGLGTYKILGDEVLPVIDAALTAGYRLFDTAKVYNNEKEIGDALEILLPKHNLRRENIFLTTKLHPSTEENVKKLVDESLNLLKTSYIDLYLIHYPKSFDYKDEDPLNKTLRISTWNTLVACKNEGKIRSIGVSSYEIRHLEELQELGNNFPPCCNQVEYHPHFTRDELKKYCDDHNIFFQAFSSLARHNESLLSSDEVTGLAEKYQVPKTTILLSWATSQGVGVIPKSTNPERLSQNLKTVRLEEEEIKRVSKLNLNKNYVRTTGWLVL
uniref:Aldo_ket_red domain-containing protein n=1 Tax=Caenorhabditis tropicalis TaxID=1561998 RepID=A0A1I7UVJ2_9PELO